MRKLVFAVVVMATMAFAVPAASAQTCGGLAGVARLQGHGDGTADGVAIVAFAGGIQVVAFESTLVPGGADQTWHFAEGDVDVHETATLTPIGGSLFSISSTVAVTSAGDAGSWRYAGVFNDSSLVARFAVTGRLCIG